MIGSAGHLFNVRICISIMGIVGNAFLIVCVTQTKFTRVKTFELFLLGLAVANLEDILVVNVYDIITIQSSSIGSNILLCRSLKFLTVFGEITSILFTVLISIFRYQKLRDAGKRVNLPIYLDSIRLAWMVSGACVMLSILLSVPIFTISLQGRVENGTRNIGCPPDFFQCSKSYCPVPNGIFKYLFIILCNLLPLIIVTVTGCLIVVVLLNQRKTVTPVVSVSGSSQLGRKSRGGLRHQRSTIAVLAAMGLFQVDWTLYLIFQLTFSPADLPYWGEMEFFISTSYTSISPYVYGIGNNLFSLKNLMKR